jgi:hypothetical protein
VDIDFDAASKEWKANKKYMGNGTYKYICCAKTLSGNPCTRESVLFYDYCKIHLDRHTKANTNTNTNTNTSTKDNV